MRKIAVKIIEKNNEREWIVEGDATVSELLMWLGKNGKTTEKTPVVVTPELRSAG